MAEHSGFFYIFYMALQIGIVGLPNVGKSTLFNAITKSATAAAENFPFCTIDPNVGMVEVPDDRIHQLATIVKPERVVHSAFEFVDIAGLVKGASEGEGLGNKFLSHIRECDAIAMVTRFFENDKIHHVSGKVDPKEDREIIEMELMLADLQTLEKSMEKLSKDIRAGKSEAIIKMQVCEAVKSLLEASTPARKYTPKSTEEQEALRSLHLLTAKPQLYIVNLSEEEFINFSESVARERLGLPAEEIIVPICAKTECDLIDFSEEEAQEVMQELGMTESGLSGLIRASFTLLGLESYFTAGVQEVRAWTIKKGMTAPEAAGVIHTDFSKKFIKGEICTVGDFVKFGGWAGVRDNGALQLVGKDAIIKDGDVCVWKIGA